MSNVYNDTTNDPYHEDWAPIEGFDEYLISTQGNIIHKDRPNTKRATPPNHRGFPTVVLFRRNEGSTRYIRQVSKLVIETFVGPSTPTLNSVWHKDGNLLNCWVDNLKWDMRARVMEWNEMNRDRVCKYRTPRIMLNSTGEIFENALELGLHIGEIETAIVSHIEKYPPQYADQARFQYVD